MRSGSSSPSSAASSRRGPARARSSSPRSAFVLPCSERWRRWSPPVPTFATGFRGSAGTVFNRLQRFWTSIKVAIDVAMLALAFGLAYLIRFDLLGGWPLPPPRETLVTLLLVLVLFPVAYRQSRLYATNRVRTHLEEVFELFKATITASLVLVALTYFCLLYTSP